MRERERAAAPGQPGQLALQSGGACPTNRPRLFSQLCSEHLQGWPGTPCRAWERVASQDTSSTLFHLRCQILRQRKHTRLSKQPWMLRAHFSRSPWPGCQGPGPGVSPGWTFASPGQFRARRGWWDMKGTRVDLKRPCQAHEIRFPQPWAWVSTWLRDDSDTRKPADPGGAPGFSREPAFLIPPHRRNPVI